MTEARTLLVSAGPSREFIDDVRFLSNPSTGSMGIAVAEAAAQRGWRVHLALGPTHLRPDPALDRIELHPFVSALDLEAIAVRLWPEVDAFVATAAVADYRPAERITGKRKKEPGDWTVRFVRNPDVLANRGREKGHRTLVGFALEAVPDVTEARRKQVEKNLDLIILNTAINFGSPGGDFTWIEAERSGEPGLEATRSEPIAKPARTKLALAREIVSFLEERGTTTTSESKR